MSRSAGSHRHSEDAARRQKVQAQQKYALELQEQQSARHRAEQVPADRKRIQRRAQSPIQQSSILSSPTSTYTSASGRNRGTPPLTDRERARQKQLDYHRQLEADKQVKVVESPRHSRRDNGQRMTSPINRASPGRLSERDLKHQRQQEYASQLKLDMQQNSSSMADKRGNRSEPNLRSAPSNRSDLGINIGGGGGQLSRREKQEEYAKQIREASEKEEIFTPRQALCSRRPGHSPQQDSIDRNTGTGLALGGDAAATAEQRANKRERQSKYRDELANGSRSKPIASSHVALHSNRSRQDEELGIHGGGAAGFSTAGLIGNQESEHEKMRKKRESQKEYFEQLRTGSSPTKEKARNSGYGDDYSKPVTRESDNMNCEIRAPPDYAPSRDDSNYSQYDLQAPSGGVLSQRLAQAHSDPYEQSVSQDNRYSEGPYSARQDSFDMLEKMRADSQSRIIDDHYSPTKPVVSEDGNVSFDGINPPHGRYNKGMNVPDMEGKLPSARQPQRQHPYPHPHQQQYQQEYQQQQQDQQQRDQQYSDAHQGTSLLIGKMDVQTSEIRDRKAYEQQKYVQELEQEKGRPPIQNERVSLIQQNKYQGNGLPGSNVPQMHGGPRRGHASSQLYQQGQQQGQEQQQHYAGHRGTSTGGGASSIVLGGGYGAGESPRMHRKGGREEYAQQMHQQQQPEELYQQHQQYYQQDDFGNR
jgi:hypothetical protein